MPPSLKSPPLRNFTGAVEGTATPEAASPIFSGSYERAGSPSDTLSGIPQLTFQVKGRSIDPLSGFFQVRRLRAISGDLEAPRRLGHLSRQVFSRGTLSWGGSDSRGAEDCADFQYGSSGR